MIVRQEQVNPINFEGLVIRDFTAGRQTRASFAVIEVPAGVRHREAWSRRSDKYYYVVSGRVCFTVEGAEQQLSEGGFCLVTQGQKFSYENRSDETAVIALFHVPGFDLGSEVFTGQD